MKYIVKGRVKNLVRAGNSNVLRPGSYDFLPGTEVLLAYTDNSKNILEEKFRVCGRSRTGFYKLKNLYFKYLCDLRIEPLPEPDERTMAFIDKHSILCFEEAKLPEVKNWLDFFEKSATPEILDGQISDEIFVSAQQFVKDIQSLITANHISALLDNHVRFPLNIRTRGTYGRIVRKDRDAFEKEMMPYFTTQVCASILTVNPDLIFPIERNMLIGLTEIAIRKNSGMKIHSIVGDYVHPEKIKSTWWMKSFWT